MNKVPRHSRKAYLLARSIAQTLKERLGEDRAFELIRSAILGFIDEITE